MPRPKILQGVTTAIETGSGRVHITVNEHEGQVYETFVMLGKAGSEERALTEALGRVISKSVQGGVPLEELARALRGISSESIYGFGPNRVLSVADAVGRVLLGHATEERTDGQDTDEPAHQVGDQGDQGTGRAVSLDGPRLRTA